MTPPAEQHLRMVHPAPVARPKIAPDAVLGMLLFLGAESMFFAAFISAFVVTRASNTVWPPPGQPRLPIEATGFNTAVLLCSALALYYAKRRYEQAPSSARVPYAAAIGMGTFFLLFQGAEWFALLKEGFTLYATPHSAFFYLIVGFHAVHVVAGLAGLVVLFARLLRNELLPDSFWAARLYWYFVVGLWPFLYWQVYL